VPLYGYADGRNYLLMPVASDDPKALSLNGKAYTKIVGGKAQLFFESDDGTVYQVTPGVPAQAAPFAVWRAGVPSTGQFFETWAELEPLIASNFGNITIFVDSSIAPCEVPIVADTELFGRTKFLAYDNNIVTGSTFTILDGGRIRNPYTVQGIRITVVATAISPILLDIPGQQFILREGGRLQLDDGSTVPAISMTGNFSEIANFEGSALLRGGAVPPLVPIVGLAPGIAALYFRISIAGDSQASNSYSQLTFSGDGTNFLIIGYDSSAPPVSQTLYTGGQLLLGMSQASATTYDDSIATPSLGQTTTQAAIDVLKRRVVGFGNTASRPAIPADVDTGGMYFDTDLGYAINSNGVVWVNAAGVPV